MSRTDGVMRTRLAASGVVLGALRYILADSGEEAAWRTLVKIIDDLEDEVNIQAIERKGVTVQ
jgi:hypothetical protein